jgi:hypothetical protein
MKREWRPVAGYEGYYEVSNFGDVRSVTRDLPFKGTLAPRAGKNLSPETCHAGHRRVRLWKEGIGRRFFVHRLVLEAFVCPCPAGMEACHNDNDAGNNRISNLRWDTRGGNFRDKSRFGTNPVGERASRSKLTKSQVLEIRSIGKSVPASTIAGEYGVTPSAIRAILNGRNWRHIS